MCARTSVNLTFTLHGLLAISWRETAPARAKGSGHLELKWRADIAIRSRVSAPVTGVTAGVRHPMSSDGMVAREADMLQDPFCEGDGPGPEAAERYRRSGEMLWLLRRSPRHAGWGARRSSAICCIRWRPRAGFPSPRHAGGTRDLVLARSRGRSPRDRRPDRGVPDGAAGQSFGSSTSSRRSATTGPSRGSCGNCCRERTFPER